MKTSKLMKITDATLTNVIGATSFYEAHAALEAIFEVLSIVAAPEQLNEVLTVLLTEINSNTNLDLEGWNKVDIDLMRALVLEKLVALCVY